MTKEEDLKKFITNALKEDVGDGDHTSQACISVNAKNKAQLLVKDDGIIAGIGGIVIFLPQIILLMFFMTILEDTGYMTRVTFMMDKFMTNIRRFL